jgi:hypothetical protein
MNGIVIGGWEFVIAAYALTAIALGWYGVTIVTSSRAARRRAEADPQ